MGEPVSREMHRRQFLGTAAAAVGASAFTLNLAAASHVAHAAESQSAAMDPPPGATWTQVLSKSDEFNGTALNTSKWTTDHWNETSKQVAFQPENVTVSDGNLHIWTRRVDVPVSGKNYTVGIVRSTFTIPGNSYTEVRARMIPYAAKVNSAIWLHNQAIPENNPNVEIDMQEYHLQNTSSNRKHIHSGLHLWKKDPNEHVNLAHTEWDHPSANLDDGYHLYGLERRGGQVKFYIDDDQYWSYDAVGEGYPDVASQPRPIILCCNGNAGTPVAAELPAQMLVDHVRVYTAN